MDFEHIESVEELLIIFSCFANFLTNQKNPRSRILKSGEFADWNTDLM